MHPLARALHARIADPVRVDAYYAPLAVACFGLVYLAVHASRIVMAPCLGL